MSPCCGWPLLDWFRDAGADHVASSIFVSYFQYAQSIPLKRTTFIPKKRLSGCVKYLAYLRRLPINSWCGKLITGTLITCRMMFPAAKVMMYSPFCLPKKCSYVLPSCSLSTAAYRTLRNQITLLRNGTLRVTWFSVLMLNALLFVS